MAKENYLLPLTLILGNEPEEAGDAKVKKAGPKLVTRKFDLIASRVVGYIQQDGYTEIMVTGGDLLKVAESFDEIYRMANSHGVYHRLGNR